MYNNPGLSSYLQSYSALEMKNKIIILTLLMKTIKWLCCFKKINFSAETVLSTHVYLLQYFY